MMENQPQPQSPDFLEPDSPETDQSSVENNNPGTLPLTDSSQLIQELLGPPNPEVNRRLTIVLTFLAIMAFLALAYWNSLWPFQDLFPPLPPMSEPVRLQDIGPTPGGEISPN